MLNKDQKKQPTDFELITVAKFTTKGYSRKKSHGGKNDNA